MKYAECLSVYRHFCCSEFKWKSGWEKKDSSLMHVLKEKIGSSCTKVEILSFSEKAEHSTPFLGGTLFCTLALFILCLVQRGQTISQEEKNCCTYLCVCATYSWQAAFLWASCPHTAAWDLMSWVGILYPYLQSIVLLGCLFCATTKKLLWCDASVAFVSRSQAGQFGLLAQRQAVVMEIN